MASKPSGSNAAFSDAKIASPTFTPDKPGTYTLQLIVNDYFTDSAPSYVTITATPVQSRISVTPNYSTPLRAGSNSIAFDVNNIGRVSVSSGSISMTLKDPLGNIVATGSQAFSAAVGQTTTVSIPATLPSLRFGNYTLTFTQSDETRTGSPTSVNIANSTLAAFSFDKTTYKVRDTANLTLNLMNTGRFNLDPSTGSGLTVTVSVPDAGYAGTSTVSIGQGQALTLQYAIQIPDTITAGQHGVSVALTLPSGSSTIQSSIITIPGSALSIGYSGTTTLTASDNISLSLENTGGLDTSYTTNKLVLKDAVGLETAAIGNISGVVSAGELKTLNITIPSQTAKGYVALSLELNDAKTGKLSSLYKTVYVNGLTGSLSAKTDKDVYMNTEAITAISAATSSALNIDSGNIDLKVIRYNKTSGGEFKYFLPILNQPVAITVASDGSTYVADTYNHRIQKLDNNGNFITKWGSYGSGDGQFNSPCSIAIGPDSLIYVADRYNNRIQKFDSSGNFIAKWGTGGWGNGQLNQPYAIVFAKDGSVYVADGSDSNNNRIQKFDVYGNFIGRWGNNVYGNFGYISGLAVAADGTVYVADRYYASWEWHNRIQKFDENGSVIAVWWNYVGRGIAVSSDGFVYVIGSNNNIQKLDSNKNLIAQWGSYGSGNGQFNSPYGIAIASDGSVYVSDTGNNRVQKFDGNGNFIWKWGSEVSFYYPVRMAADLGGSVYVLDANDDVQKLDSNGKLITKWGSSGNGNGQFGGPYGIAVSSEGSVYVADTGNHRIQKFDSNGNWSAKWGSRGSGDGQFAWPKGIAVGPDGYIYVADTDNNRIQKLDTLGNFISKWGDLGDGNGQFSSPSGIAVGYDGFVYVADTSNNRIQKFDSNGNFIAKWGSWTYWSHLTDGQFYYPYDIALDFNGSVYVADTYNNRIQKLDSNGNFIAKWGSYGGGEGQFSNPGGIAIVPNGSAYVADTYNHRIQRMEPFTSGSETLFETTVPITQPANITVDYTTAIGALNTTGMLYLDATLKNSIGQTIATSEYPFTVSTGTTALIFNVDKKVYKSDETITVTGQASNKSATDAANLSLAITSQKTEQGASKQTVYTKIINIPANGSYPFTFTTSATTTGTVSFSGTLSQNGATMAEATVQYEIALPSATVSVSALDVVGRNPFDLNVELKNTGKADITLQVGVSPSPQPSSAGGVGETLTIKAGETKLLQYTEQIAATTTYTVTLTGDVSQTVTKTVAYGEGANIQLGVGSWESGVKPEGKVGIPVTITNTGQVDENLTIAYSLSPLAANQTKTYYLPIGSSVADTLYYDLTAGSYQLSATSSQPSATAQTSFIVGKENDVTMTNTVGAQGTPVSAPTPPPGYPPFKGTGGPIFVPITVQTQDSTGYVPVRVNLINKGGNTINGSIALAVMSNQGKAVWRGTAQVTDFMPGASTSYIINIDATGIVPGAYNADIILYSTSGQQLASNQTKVKISGAIFEIMAMPNYPTFTAGRQATLTFTIKNTGTVSGTTSFTVKAMDILNQSATDTLNPGEEMLYTFNFTVPEDGERKDYLADYALTPVSSQGTTGQSKFRVAGVNVGVAATLDKTAYKNGDTALLTMTVSKLTQFDDGTYLAIIRYGAYHDMKSFTLSNQPATLTFSVPLAEITGENLFYGVHFESGKDIYTNSLFLNMAQPDLVVSNLAAGSGSTRTQKIDVGVANIGDLASEASTVRLYDGDPSAGGVSISSLGVSSLAKDESAASAYNWNILGKAGKHSIYAVVDPDNTVIERAEANNTSWFDITIPDFALEISTTKTQYEANQDAGIAETVINMTVGTTYNNAVLTSTIKDSGWNTVKTFTNAISNLLPGENSFANSWNTGSNRPGSYTVTADVGGGGVTPPLLASTAFEILSTVSAYGDMTLSSAEVIQGFPMDISYTLTNNGNVDIDQAEVKFEVENKTTHTTTTLAASTLDYLAVLAIKTGTNAIEKVDVEPGEYTVILVLTAGGKTINISSKDLTVKPPVKVTKGISILPRVLVWTTENNSPQSPLNLRGEAKGTNEIIAIDALTKLGAYYKVVHSESEFIESMRSGYYNTYALLDTGKPTTDGLTSELVEKAYGGDTLVLTGNSNMDDIKITEVTGTKFTGYLPDAVRTTTIGMPLYDQPVNITISGKAQKVTMTSATAYTSGAITNTYPTVTINSYGKGKGVLVAFDLGGSAETVNDITTYSALFGRVIGDTAPIETRLISEGVVPVEITVESLGSAFDLKIVEKTDSRIAILDAGLNGSIDAINDTVTWNTHIDSNQTVRYLYLSGLTSFRGTYPTEAEVYYQNKGEYRLYNRYPLNIELTEGTAEMQNNILNAINLLSVTKDMQGTKDSIVKSYTTLISRSSGTRKDIDRDIHDLLKIMEDLKKLSGDIRGIRSGLDDLLGIFQRRWFLGK